MFGMSYEKFWHNGLDAFFVYMKSYETREKNKMKDLETSAWYIGQYVISALSCKPIMSYGMTSGKDIKNIARDYPARPHWLDSVDKNNVLKNRKVVQKAPTKEQYEAYVKKMKKIKNKK